MLSLNRPQAGRLLHTFFILLLLSVVDKLCAQPVLIDSIEQRLRVETGVDQQMDLLIGLCRATLFAHGGESIKPVVARARQHALQTADSVGLARALLFQYMSDFVVEDGIPQEVLEALRISQSAKNKNLELFAIYHIAKHFLYDKNDLINTRLWLDRGHKMIKAGLNPKHRGNLYKETALYHEAKGNRDSMDYWLEAALTEFEQVGRYQNSALGRTPSGNWDQGTMNQNQVLNYQGNNAVARGNFQLAQQKFAAALDIAQNWQVDNALSRTLSNIGEMQTAMGDIEGAIASLSAALEIHKVQQNKLYASTTAQRIGR